MRLLLLLLTLALTLNCGSLHYYREHALELAQRTAIERRAAARDYVMPEEVEIHVAEAVCDAKADCEARHAAALDHIVKEAEEAADQAVKEAIAADTSGSGRPVVPSTPERMRRARQMAAEIYNTPTNMETPPSTPR